MRVLRHPVLIIVVILVLIEISVRVGTALEAEPDPLAGTRYASFVGHVDDTRPEGRFFDAVGLPIGASAADAPIWLLGGVPAPGHGLDLARRLHEATGQAVVDMTQTDHVIDQTRVLFIEALRTGTRPRTALFLAGAPCLAAPVIGLPLHLEQIQDILEARAGNYAMQRDLAAARIKTLVLLDHLLNRPSQAGRPPLHDALPFGLRKRGSAPEDAEAVVRNLRLNREVIKAICDDMGIACALAWDPEVFRQDFQPRFQELDLDLELLKTTGRLVNEALASDPESGFVLSQPAGDPSPVQRLASALADVVGRAQP
jgi:hypothetical protein